MSELKIVNWDKWQTYRKDRGTPPWIKIHRSLLTNSEWARLSDALKGHLISLWLIAADKHGVIPSDPLALRKMCMLDKEPNIKRFIELGFLEKIEPSSGCQDGTQSSTTCQPLDAPETETETETETEVYMRFCFEEDWKKYPRKRGSKKKAWQEYQKAVGNDLENNRPKFLSKMDQQISLTDDIQFMLYAETFFRNWQNLEFEELPLETKDEKRDREIHEMSEEIERERKLKERGN